ncbi:ATP-dependent DNA helicase PIF1 [Neodiprion virginianus]|uniref:ATP-dependent DNA helicase PIF1 n=1 Tax=Neodiprion virginianus TaxID=2961670 RepID=UPI001EE71074|nr:ATP-dependent DNA helicase PIF1 [Neodiprion virginianus]
MDSTNFLKCAVVLQYLNNQGSLSNKVSYSSATLRIIRNGTRQMLMEIQPDKRNGRVEFPLTGFTVFKKFITEGKASIKFLEQNCTLFMSNAPPAQLISFLKMIFVKMTGQPGKNPSQNPLRDQLLSNKPLQAVQEISPATSAEVNKAKEKAIGVSRATFTTPSPSNVRKRKIIDHSKPKIPLAKKLYNNPTVSNLTEEQTAVLSAAIAGQSLFFTGSAGTGKSFLLKRIIAALPPDVTVATASTGVAACHIGGITLHQFASIGIGSASLEKCYELASRPTAAQIWRRTKHLVIDEISMVDGDYFDKIEAVARRIRKNDKPFGGIQLVLCGDFLQLPPVAKLTDKVKFCFQSKSWRECVKHTFELQKVHRQTDPTFINILNNVRIGRVTDEIAKILVATSSQQIEKDGILATRLCTHINDANLINESKLEQLHGECRTFLAEDSDTYMTKTLDQQLPVASKLDLKVGAQVMLLKNINIADGLVNGARGVVIKFAEDAPVVRFRCGKEYRAKLDKWTIKTAAGLVITRKQIPLKLAWAFSIHKSQGLTLDCVEMSLGRVFDAGQAYVALSRAQNLQALRVLDFSAKQVWANPVVLEFYKKFRRHLRDMEMIPLGKKPRKV